MAGKHRKPGKFRHNKDGASTPDTVNDKGDPGWIAGDIDGLREFIENEEARQPGVSRT